MPVPIAVTHPQGAGLKAAKAAELPTEGPFARMARLKAEQEAAAAAAAAANGGAQQCAAANGDAATAAAAAGPGPGSQQQQQQAVDAMDADGAGAANGGSDDEPAIVVRDLEFSYPGLDGRPIPGEPPLITGMSLALPRGSRCLLIGANGAGKTTLLKILGGKHMVPRVSPIKRERERV